jgi:hypothetical protein
MTQHPPTRNEPCASSRARHPAAAFFTAPSTAILLAIPALAIVTTSSAYEKSASISFKDAIAFSETIAIVRLVEVPEPIARAGPLPPKKATLDVLQVLKGHLKLGKQQVEFAAYPGRRPGEFIAFLDKNRVWTLTARPLTGRKVASDVLGIEMFAHFDQFVIIPGLITLQQLKTYLKDGTLHYSLEGPLCFPQRGNPAWKASGIRIALTYDAVKERAHVTGLPTLAGLPAEPEVCIEYDAPESLVHLNYSRGPDRPLELQGLVESLDPKSGAMLARFVVNGPMVLDAGTLQKYLADPRLGRCYYKCRLHCAANKQYPKLKDLVLTLKQGIGPIGTLDGWDGGSLKIESTTFCCPNCRVWSNGYVPDPIEKTSADDWFLRMSLPPNANQHLILAFDVGKRPKGPEIAHFTGENAVVYHACSAPTRGAVQLFDGKTWQIVTTFTVDLDPLAFGNPP